LAIDKKGIFYITCHERSRVNGDRIKSYVAWLARNELQVRKSGTEGYPMAVEWVVSKNCVNN